MTGCVEVGFWLSSEEHGARDLVELAVAAEDHGFAHAMISDHLHPWVPEQGHAPFVWGVLGAIGRATSALHLATGVTAPTARMHPVVVAHAAATAAVLLEGRFALGVGTGERLNEHVVGGPWPRPAIRRAHLQEAVHVLRRLFDGDEVSFDGDHVTVEHAQLYTRPSAPPPIWIAASGPRSARVAGIDGDGLIALAPDPSLVSAYRSAGGTGPRVAQLHVCWAPTEDEARATARRWWPNGGMPPSVLSELARPRQIAEVADLVSEDDVAQQVLCGPDPEPIARAVLRFGAAGFTRVYLHQVGPDQQGFLDLWAKELGCLLSEVGSASGET
jgi:G6PDH family F420-dependent oxidoreductase